MIVRCLLIMAVLWMGSRTIIVAQPALQQVRLSEWQTFSSLANVRMVAQDRRGVIWAGASGGVFSYNLFSRQVQEFRNIDALFGLDITALAIDPATDRLYAGGAGGVINIFDGQQWSPVTDIFTANLQNKRINDFAFRDSLVFVAGEFGLTVFNANRRVFAETVTRLGGFQPGVAVRKLTIAQGRLWAATEAGVASAPLTSRSFANPTVWTMYTLRGAPSGQAVNGLAEQRGIMHITSGQAVWRLSTSNTFEVERSFNAATKSLVSLGQELYVGTDTEIHTLSGARIASNLLLGSMTTTDSAGTLRLTLATANGVGFVTLPTNRIHYLTINSPTSNRFRNMVIDPTGALWTVSGSGAGSASVINDGPGSGISRLVGSEWTNFLPSNTPNLASTGYYLLSAAPDSSIYAASWGAGIARLLPRGGVRGDSVVLTRFTNMNSRLRGLSGGDFVVGGTVRTDERGTAWMLSFTTSDSIVARDAQGRFYIFGRPSADFCTFPIPMYLAIDLNGTKWIAQGAPGALWAFSERGTLDNIADDQWRCVRTLPTGVTSMSVDANGELWIATRAGILRVLNPFDALSNREVRIEQVQRETPLAGVINALVVDALNNKWVATNTGVFVLNEDGSRLLAHITTENSPLVSNRVFSIALDDNSGRAYFGTDNGLSSAQTLSVKPNATLDNLRCYPQPFIPEEDAELVIDGLAPNSQVKISTIDGLLVRSLPVTNSRTVLWDGRNERGEIVQQGVYLVAAFSSANDGSTAVTKVMVLNRR